MQLMCTLHLVMHLIMSETLIPCLHHSLVLLCDLFLEFQQRVSRLCYQHFGGNFSFHLQRQGDKREKFSSYVGRQFLGPTGMGEGASALSFQRNCE